MSQSHCSYDQVPTTREFENLRLLSDHWLFFRWANSRATGVRSVADHRANVCDWSWEGRPPVCNLSATGQPLVGNNKRLACYRTTIHSRPVAWRLATVIVFYIKLPSTTINNNYRPVGDQLATSDRAVTHWSPSVVKDKLPTTTDHCRLPLTTRPSFAHRLATGDRPVSDCPLAADWSPTSC